MLRIGDSLFPNHYDVLTTKFHNIAKTFELLRRRRPENGPASPGDETELPLSESPKSPWRHVLCVAIDLAQLVLYSVLVVAEMVVRGSVASFIAICDTCLWVAICFAMATPMILSGLYEATLDRTIIEAIQHEGMLIQSSSSERRTSRARQWYSTAVDGSRHQEPAVLEGQVVGEKGDKQGDTGAAQGVQPDRYAIDDTGHVKFKQAVHLLYAVLVGNLALEAADDDGGSDNDPSRAAAWVGQSAQRRQTDSQSERISAWRDIKTLVDRFPDVEPAPGSPEVHALDEERHITQTRLKSMLGCQPSFGAAIGGPIVFFLGSFLFSVFSNLTDIGDNDTAHALAFGIWWVTIPHVAVVSGCLLAGNNPNTLEVIMTGVASWAKRSHQQTLEASLRRASTFRRQPSLAAVPTALFQAIRSPTIRTSRSASGGGVTSPTAVVGTARPAATEKHVSHVLDVVFKDFYDSVYQPAWMWERGRSKRNWIRRVQLLYRRRERAYGLSAVEWLYLVLLTLFLVATPYLLAFLTSFYTPQVGLSCRSFTFTLYFIFQVILAILWLADFHREQPTPLVKRAAVPWGSGKRRDDSDNAGRQPTRMLPLPTPFACLLFFGLAGAAFSTIAGTLLQIIGVYRNCLCGIPMSSWISKQGFLVIGTNTAERIYYARRFWLQTGVASIILLIVTCYVGWWYQRHWRIRFTRIIDELLGGENALVPGHGHSQPATGPSPLQQQWEQQPRFPHSPPASSRAVVPADEEADAVGPLGDRLHHHQPPVPAPTTLRPTRSIVFDDETAGSHGASRKSSTAQRSTRSSTSVAEDEITPVAPKRSDI